MVIYINSRDTFDAFEGDEATDSRGRTPNKDKSSLVGLGVRKCNDLID